MASYKTPGVYVKEISIFPPSVAQVETAIPAFVGYTEHTERSNGNTLIDTPVKISSLLDYTTIFGTGPSPSSLVVKLDASNNPRKVEIKNKYYLYDSLRMFYNNGGGDAYIVSVGSYEDDINDERLIAGLHTLKKEDEPTMIVIPDAALITENAKQGSVYQQVLDQCNTLQDRFGIFDVKTTGTNAAIDDDILAFRDNIGINYLKYGAAYFPFIQTTLSIDYSYKDISLVKDGGGPIKLENISPDTKSVDRLNAAIASLEGEDITSSLAKLNALKDTDFEAQYNGSTDTGKMLIVHRANIIKTIAESIIGLTVSGPNKVRSKHVLGIIERTVASGGPLESIIHSLTSYDLGYGELSEGGTAQTPLGAINIATDFASYSLGTVTEDATIYGTTEGETAWVAASEDAFETLLSNSLGVIDDIISEVEQMLNGLNKLLVPLDRGGSDPQTYREWFNTEGIEERAQIEHWVNVIKQMAIDILRLSSNGPFEAPSEEVLKLIDKKVVKASTDSDDSELKDIIQTLTSYDIGYSAFDLGSNPIGIINPATEFGNNEPFTNAPNYDLGTVTAADPAIYEGTSEEEWAKSSAGAFNGLFERTLTLLNNLVSDTEQTIANLETELESLNPIYANIVAAIDKENITLPPSGIMAGIYTAVDNNRGVWKAPANVSLSSVVGPVVKIDDKEQEDLNIDVNAGKSINAIRAFAGKGTLVWGARTLAGNDNEWRYISVRRFFNMVEESIKKSTAWAVFEPNDASTWDKVRSMIRNFLLQQWKEGALQGATPDDAFFVNIGLGLTMTYDDILNGFMKVQIGMAVVRPAEFIILEFSHKVVENA